MTMAGLIHGKLSHSAVGDVVSWLRVPPPRAGWRKSSGGRLEVEKTSASCFPSGESTTVWPPSSVVRRKDGRTERGRRYAFRSNGETSLVCNSHAVRSGGSSALSTSHFPRVRCRRPPRSSFILKGGPRPSASETSPAPCSPGSQPPHPSQG